jgi:hypothetical protein
MECNARYRIIGRNAFEGFSSGRTVNMSGSGILLVTESVLPPGFLIEIEIDWPVRLADDVRLKMVVKGQIVRSENNDVARAGVKIFRYSFYTASRWRVDL